MKKTLLSRFILSFLALVILSFNSLCAQTELIHINDIKVKGLYRVTKGAVLLALPISVGDDVTKEDIQYGLKQVFATKNFDDIEASLEDGGVLVISVKERPTIVGVSYAGNDAVKTEQLEEIIKAQGIKVGETLDIQTLKELEGSLEDFYNGMGRYQAKVNTILVYLPRNRVDVKFNFIEGVRAKIDQINIVGNKDIPEERLLAQLELRDNVPWWNFVASRTFQSQLFNADLETLRSYYMNRGYVRFEIKNSRVEITPDRKSIYLTINIREGDQYVIDKFQVIGETYGHKIEMEKIIPLEKGEIYNAASVSHVEEMLASYMGKFGYAYTKVKAYPVIDDENKTVSLNFNVSPGKRIYVSEVKIVGNSVTTDEVIRREIRQMDGTWLSNEAISTSKRRLNQLGFFESVEVEPKNNGISQDTVDVVTTVKERPTGSVKAGVGFGTESGVILSGEVSQDNFLGYGGKASLGINTNKYNKKIELTYDEPYFTLDAISLGGRVFYEEFEAGDANIVDYNNKRYGAGLNIGYPLDEHNFISYGLTYEHNKISQTNSYVQIQRFWDIYADADRDSGEVKFENFRGSIYYGRNYLDRGVLPTEGNKQTVNLQATVPGSDTQFYKIQANTTHFFPLDKYKKFIFNFRAKAGYGNAYGTKNGYDQIYPFFENFYLGGDEWLRGFKYNSAGPKAFYSTTYLGNKAMMVTDDAVGGNAIVAGSFQLIVPTPFASEGYENQLRTSIFVDVGSVWDTSFDEDRYNYCASNCDDLYDFSDPSEYRASAGVTLQWISPMGPLGFTLARPIKEKEGDRTEFFSFSLGRTF
jgi:outer membrane protein insertion porin family